MKNIPLRDKKWIIPAAHFLGWLLFLSIPFLSQQPRHNMPHGAMPQMHDPRMFYPRREFDWNGMRNLNVVNDILLIAVFYMNLFFIAPLLTRQKKYSVYLLIQAVNMTLYYLLLQILKMLLITDDRHMPLGMQVFSYVVIVLVSLCIGLITEHARVEGLQKEKENDMLRTELNFLRWQISPHFLFNVLNNMVSLARVRSDKLEAMLLDLSNLMRYMLYENDEHKISIAREKEYLYSYIDLQRSRLGKDVVVNTDIFIADRADEQDTIEPMLLIPFIENAFKHGIGTVKDPVIDINVHFDHNMLTMVVRNKYVEMPEETKDSARGIGLVNVQKRLNLLYPGKHSLHTDNGNDWYVITLGINLTR